MHHLSFSSLLALTSLVLTATAAFAQQARIVIPTLNEQGEAAPIREPFVFGPPDRKGRLEIQTCEQAVGERVRVEGIGWHPEGGEKLWNPESLPRVIFEEGVVYVRAADFDRRKAHGKLVRVAGMLKPYAELNELLKRIYGQPVAGCAIEFLHRREPPRYYLVEASSLQVVPSIERPRLELLPDK